MLPRRNFLQFLGLASAAPMASAAAPLGPTRYGMAVTGMGVLRAAPEPEVPVSLASSAVGQSSEEVLEEALGILKHRKSKDSHIDRRTRVNADLDYRNGVENANISSLRSTSNSFKTLQRIQAARNMARLSLVEEAEAKVEEILRNDPALRASKAFMDYINGDGK